MIQAVQNRSLTPQKFSKANSRPTNMTKTPLRAAENQVSFGSLGSKLSKLKKFFESPSLFLGVGTPKMSELEKVLGDEPAVQLPKNLFGISQYIFKTPDCNALSLRRCSYRRIKKSENLSKMSDFAYNTETGHLKEILIRYLNPATDEHIKEQRITFDSASGKKLNSKTKHY